MDLRDQVRQLKRKRNLWSLRSNTQKPKSTSWHVFERVVKRYADICKKDEYRDSSFPIIFECGSQSNLDAKKSDVVLLPYVFAFLV